MSRKSVPIQEKKRESSLVLIAQEDITRPRKKLAPSVKKFKDKTKYNRKREKYAAYDD